MSTWMVVEDEPDIYGVLLAMFEIWGIEGIAFVDGAEAVAWIEDIDRGELVGELPDLAILDIRLPEIAGPDVGARLRRSPRLGEVAMVLITAYRLSPDEEVQVKAHAQADALMYKPFPAMEELRRALDQIIAKRQEAAAGRRLAAEASAALQSDTTPTTDESPAPVGAPVDSAKKGTRDLDDPLKSQIIKTEPVKPDPKLVSEAPSVNPGQPRKHSDTPVESSVSTPPGVPPTSKPQLS